MNDLHLEAALQFSLTGFNNRTMIDSTPFIFTHGKLIVVFKRNKFP